MTKLPVVATIGRPRKLGYVRVFKVVVGQRELVRIQWRKADGTVGTESFPDSRKGIADAKAFANGVHDTLVAKPAPVATFQPLTLRQVWEKYAAAHAKAWRPRIKKAEAAKKPKLEMIK